MISKILIYIYRLSSVRVFSILPCKENQIYNSSNKSYISDSKKNPDSCSLIERISFPFEKVLRADRQVKIKNETVKN